MKPLLVFCILFAGAQSAEAVIQVTGYVGGSSMIRCPYDREHERRSKYLCRGKCGHIQGKDIPVKMKNGSINPAVNGRFSLHDDTSARVFTVTITGLTAEDSGKYWCVISLKRKHDVYTEVELNVIPAPLPNPTPTPCPEVTSLTYWAVRVTVIVSLLTLTALCFNIWHRRTSSHVPEEERSCDSNGPLTEDKTRAVSASMV